LFVYVIGYVAFLFYVVRSAGAEGAIFYGFLGGAAGVVALFARRAAREQTERLAFSITGARQPPRVLTEVSSDVRNYLAGRAIITSSILARAASEARIQAGVSSLAQEAGMRRAVNNLLRKNGLWEKLDLSEASMMDHGLPLTSTRQRHFLNTSGFCVGPLAWMLS
jgi:hypothetical protein